MKRAFMIRKLTSDFYEWMLFELKVLKQFKNIICEEINKIMAEDAFFLVFNQKNIEKKW